MDTCDFSSSPFDRFVELQGSLVRVTSGRSIESNRDAVVDAKAGVASHQTIEFISSLGCGDQQTHRTCDLEDDQRVASEGSFLTPNRALRF